MISRLQKNAYMDFSKGQKSFKPIEKSSCHQQDAKIINNFIKPAFVYFFYWVRGRLVRFTVKRCGRDVRVPSGGIQNFVFLAVTRIKNDNFAAFRMNVVSNDQLWKR